MQKETQACKPKTKRNQFVSSDYHMVIQCPSFSQMSLKLSNPALHNFSNLFTSFFMSQYGNEDFLSELITKACGR